MHFLLLNNLTIYIVDMSENVCGSTLSFGQYIIRICSKLYRQIESIPMGSNCAPLVTDLFLFCYERDFMLFLSDNNQADKIEDFNSTSRYVDDSLIDNLYFEQMIGQIYPSELQLNKAKSFDTEASPPMVYIFLSLFVLQECVLTLMTSTTELYF